MIEFDFSSPKHSIDTLNRIYASTSNVLNDMLYQLLPRVYEAHGKAMFQLDPHTFIKNLHLDVWSSSGWHPVISQALNSIKGYTHLLGTAEHNLINLTLPNALRSTVWKMKSLERTPSKMVLLKQPGPQNVDLIFDYRAESLLLTVDILLDFGADPELLTESSIRHQSHTHNALQLALLTQSYPLMQRLSRHCQLFERINTPILLHEFGSHILHWHKVLQPEANEHIAYDKSLLWKMPSRSFHPVRLLDDPRAQESDQPDSDLFDNHILRLLTHPFCEKDEIYPYLDRLIPLVKLPTAWFTYAVFCIHKKDPKQFLNVVLCSKLQPYLAQLATYLKFNPAEASLKSQFEDALFVAHEHTLISTTVSGTVDATTSTQKGIESINPKVFQKSENLCRL